ncbi:hypothetical protein MRX96_037854 [Rhipicephalus microplus]
MHTKCAGACRRYPIKDSACPYEDQFCSGMLLGSIYTYFAHFQFTTSSTAVYRLSYCSYEDAIARNLANHQPRPTELSPTPVEPTEVPTTSVEPTQLPTTSVEPTELPTTSDQPTELSMTSVKSTDLTTTTVEPTKSMGTSTATSPPASNTSTVTEATTEPVFPAQPPMTPFPVVRLFGTATNESQPLPADGVCDYTFYDGLYDTGSFDTLYSPHFSAPVEHVLSHASLHSVSEYGLSFAYRNASQVARDLKIPEVSQIAATNASGAQRRRFRCGGHYDPSSKDNHHTKTRDRLRTGNYAHRDAASNMTD